MAENILTTRILLRYDTYSAWMSSSVILKQGEAAIATFPYQKTIITSDTSPAHTPPAVGIKIGNGRDYFKDLPWLQAVAADVYSWAKSDEKPLYTAQEIQGLQSFVENLISGDVEVSIAPRIYSLVRGTGVNSNKYYLQYKENTEESAWIIDTSESIDLSNLVRIFNWITDYDLTHYDFLSDRTDAHIHAYLDNLSLSSPETGSTVVTGITQTDGQVAVTKRQLTFSDLTGQVDIIQGGTGRNSLTEGEVLIGNGINPILTIPIDTEVSSTDHLVSNRAVKTYIDRISSGLTGAMHFIGEANVVILPDSTVNPNISGYNFSTAQAGDVILYNAKEFVWTGSNWRLLGDEGSYAVKGSIKDIDIHEDAAIQQSKIANLSTDLLSKVDKIEGKSLSTNDYTTIEKTKLAGIEERAQRNIIEHIFVNGVEQLPGVTEGKANSITLTINAFDEIRAQKLDSIEYAANVNKIEHIFVNDVEQSPITIRGLSKSVNLTINNITDAERNKLADIETNAQVNKVEYITINGVSYYPANNKSINITLNSSNLNLNTLEGADIINSQSETIDIINKRLQFQRIAKTGDVSDLLQTADTYIILNCGNSTDIIN